MSRHPGASGATEFWRLQPGEETWRPAYELGLEAASLHGDESTEGIYVVRLKWPPNVMSLPHSHPEDRHVTVLSGTWYTGTGEDFDPDNAVPIGPGGHMLHPAGMVHWDGSRDEEVVIQVSGYGPSDFFPVDPDGPRFTRI